MRIDRTRPLAATSGHALPSHPVLPLFDKNPTHHRGYLTALLIIVNIVMFTFVQDRSGIDVVTLPNGDTASIAAETRFTLEHAAIPCELTQGHPLDLEEIRQLVNGASNTCDSEDGPQLFPDKSVWLAALTSMFLHGGWVHLSFNMLFLWIFGNNIEDHLGPLKFTAFYLLSGVAALVAHVALQADSSVPLIGASGAVAGVMGAYFIWFPRAPIRTLAFVFLIDVKAVYWLGSWFALQFFTAQDSGIAWAAHVGGFAFGVVIGAIIRQVRPLCRWAWRDPWREQAYYRWDLSGGMQAGGRPRFGSRSW